MACMQILKWIIPKLKKCNKDIVSLDIFILYNDMLRRKSENLHIHFGNATIAYFTDDTI